MTETMHAAFEKAAAVAPAPPELQRFWYSPEVRAGWVLGTLSIMAGFVLVLSTVGGAVGGFMRMRRKVSV
jgi:hypothetical protein